MSIVLSTDLADAPEVRLTTLAHGGGCGCKLAPSVLQQLLADQPEESPYRQLLVGTETGDDAAVWQIDDMTCVIATTDFFTPMVDDPYDFGRIAATNAISDVYAMGGRPIMALAILGMPLDKIPTQMVRGDTKGRKSSLCNGRNSGCGRSLDQFAGAHIRSRRDRHVPAARCPAQFSRQSRRCLDPDEGTRCGHLLGCHQEEADVTAERLCRDDRIDDPSQSDRIATRRGPERPRNHRRDRFRVAWTCTRSGAGFRLRPCYPGSRCTSLFRSGIACSRWPCHWRVAAQLGELL